MIEERVIAYLNTVLDTPVYMEEPIEKVPEYSVIQSIDNGRIDYIDAVTLNIRTYAASLNRAAALNKLVKEAMYNIVTLDDISSSKCGGGGQVLEGTTNRHAWECVFNLYYMED